MLETAIVTEVLEDRITVKIVPDKNCESCEGHMCKAEGREFSVRDKLGLDLKTGDCVRVYFSPGKTIFASFMVLIFPCLLFIFFYFTLGALFSVESQVVRALFGVAGLAAGFGISLLLKKRRGVEDLPEVSKKLS